MLDCFLLLISVLLQLLLLQIRLLLLRLMLQQLQRLQVLGVPAQSVALTRQSALHCGLQSPSQVRELADRPLHPLTRCGLQSVRQEVQVTTMAPHPPGPGFPEQAPSVYTTVRDSSLDIRSSVRVSRCPVGDAPPFVTAR